MKFKTLVSIALSVILLVRYTNKKQTEQNTEEIVTELKNPVEITFWHAMNGEQETALKKLVDNFTLVF